MPAPRAQSEKSAGSDMSDSKSTAKTPAEAAAAPFNVRMPDQSRLIDELNPSNELEKAMADEVAFACHALAELRKKPIEEQDANWVRHYALMNRVRASALRDLERLTAASKKARDEARLQAVLDPAPIPPKPPQDVLDRAAKNWRDRIAYLPELDDEWAFLLEPFQRVDWYMSYLADGYTEEELLRMDPRISWSDIAAMKQCEAERAHGRFDPQRGQPKHVPTYENTSLSDDLRAQAAERERAFSVHEPWPRPWGWQPGKLPELPIFPFNKAARNQSAPPGS